jgi:hypothetical protein
LDDVEESQHAIDFLNEILDLGSTYDRNHPVKILVSSRPSFLRKENLQGAFFLDIDKVTSHWRNRLWTLQERILGQATGITSLTVLHSICKTGFANPRIRVYCTNGSANFARLANLPTNWPIRRFFMKLVIIALVF